MLSGGVHVLVAQHVRHQIDIAALLIEHGTVCASELVGGDLLQGGGNPCILLDQILHGPGGDPLALEGEEQGVFMAGQRFHRLPLLQISQQRAPDFGSKGKHLLIAALARHQEGVGGEIYIVHVDAHQLADPDPGAQKQGQNGRVPDLGGLMKLLLPLGQAFSNLGDVQQIGHLVGFQADDGLFMELGGVHQGSRVVADQLLPVIILKKRPYSGQFSGFCPFVVLPFPLVVAHVEGHMLQKQLDIQSSDAIQVFQGQRGGGFSLEGFHLLRAKLEKVFQIYSVSVSRQDAGLQFHGAKIQTGKSGEFLEQVSQLQCVIFFLLKRVVAHACILKQLFVKDKFNE